MTGLSKGDFEVLDNARPQQITHFAEEGASPLTVALLIDTSSSALDILDDEKESARRFFTEMLAPADRAILVGFGRRVFVWQDLTSSSVDLNSAITHVRPLESDDPKAGTLLYDAAYMVARAKLKGLNGRKVIVILSDGLDNGGAFGQKDAIRAAQDADAVIFGIHKLDAGQFNFQRPVDGTLNAEITGWAKSLGMATLKKLSLSTGGRVFDVDGKQPLEEIFAMIRDETHHEYGLGFAAPPAESGGQYHRLEVRCHRQGVKVRARTGYYGSP